MDDRKIEMLQDEIRYLKGLLDENGIHYDFDKYRERMSAGEASEKESELVMPMPTPEMAIQFYSMFRGRKDVYSRRSKKGYFPVCENFWRYGICPKASGNKVRCQDCQSRSFKELKVSDILNHLKGEREDCQDVIGVYPLFLDGTCRFLVFDFDNHDEGDGSEDWQSEVDALREICGLNGIDVLVERSRSGRGAHLWIFFSEAVPASKARRFGDALIVEGSNSVSLKTFSYYDRMLPMQDSLSDGGLGNLIALPLQGQAVKKCNSVFVDESWHAYPDQWGKLLGTEKLTNAMIDSLLVKWGVDGNPMDVFRSGSEEDETAEPELLFAKDSSNFSDSLHREDVSGDIRIVLADGIYIGKSNLKPRAQNLIRRLAAYSNSRFYQNLALGLSTRETPRVIYSGYDEGDYIVIPRGCLDDLKKMSDAAGLNSLIIDRRQLGRAIDVAFKGELYPEQNIAAENLLSYDNGVLSAATAFGKTVVGAYMVAKRKVNTLILVHNVEIMQNWVCDLSRFLEIGEDMPIYTTPKGRVKHRNSLIGTLTSQKNTLTGIVDVAMVSSLGKDDDVNPVVKNYGMVIMDECHHAAAKTDEMVLRAVTAKYVYGLTATPKRDDGQGKKIFMLLGPVRHRYTARQRAEKQGIGHFVYPRFTRLVDLNPSENRHISDCYRMVAQSGIRNSQVISDAIMCVKQGRTPVVMTKQKDHAAMLYDALKDSADHVFLLEGGGSVKARESVRWQMAAVRADETMAVVAIGQYIGEGFNFPRLDTLLLAMPISFSNNVEQYAGRLNRDYAGKKDVIIFDYIDQHIPKLERMYHKRLKTYRRIGFEVCSHVSDSQGTVNSIFDSENYRDIYSGDLASAKSEIVVSSPFISSAKAHDLVERAAVWQENGVSLIVLTLSAEAYPEDGRQHHEEMIGLLQCAGMKVLPSSNCHERFSIIDRTIVWYGSMNFLSKEKPDDNLMRVMSAEIAQELLEVSFA